ncbi:MAG: cation:proton antiporter domain-containing protein [Parvularcula sp.]
MTPVTQIIILLLASAVFLAALRMRALAWLAGRPLVTLGVATGAGVVWTLSGLAEPNAESFRHLARFGLAMLGFFAALQCRYSRLYRKSPAAFRLAIFSPVIFAAIFSIASFLIVPSLGILTTIIIGAALMLGAAPSVATPLLTAPIAQQTKDTARLEGAATIAAALPLALLVEAGASPAGATLVAEPLFRSFAAAAIGGTMGLLAGRYLSVSSSSLPVMPFLTACAAYGAGLYTEFDPVMATIAAGLLYSEEAALKGDVRTRLWRVAEGLITPVALVAFGLLMAPFLLNANLLIFVAAAVGIVAARALARAITLRGLDLSPQDVRFLTWFGGAPGAASALLMVSLVASPATHLDDLAMSLGVVSILLGIALTRLQSKSLTSRLVQETARARKHHYART